MGLRTVLGLKKRRNERRLHQHVEGVPFHSALPAFCSSLQGRDCVIFGSAPDPVLEHRGEPIVCCNGSALSLRRLMDRGPDYTFMHCHVLARQNQSDDDVRSALGVTEALGRVVIFDEPRYSNAREMLDGRADAVELFDWSDRFSIIESLIGVRLQFLELSTGAMTVAAVLHAGAKSVQLVGFSLDRKGHSYNSNDRYRNHVRSDAALFALLAQAGFDIRSNEPSIAMILTRKIE